ncbi:9125_t:CDS:2 [Entrophospora sp. SA101]|nr:9125_t:CDS:2 [Entrophospora sp. SA101]
MCLESKTRGFATDTSSAIIPDNTDNERTSIPEESLLYKMSSQDNINPNWQKIENDVKTKLIKFLQSDEESISLDINSAIEYAFYLYYLKKIINEN